MDPLTHAASGAVAMLAFKNRPMTILAAPLAALACASPDIDLAFIHTPLEFLMLHRGITHSLAFAPFFAIPLALISWPLWRKATPFAWKFWQVWLLCIAMILLHIWLDVCTTYGTMIFLPFSHYRVRLNSIYMIDLGITLPLLWAICFWRKQPKRQILTLLWIFFLPAAGIAINHWHKSQIENSFQAEGRKVEEVHILPDAFAPLFWRVIYRETTDKGQIITSIGLNALGQKTDQGSSHRALDTVLEQKLIHNSLAGDVFFHFAMLPCAVNLPEEYLPEPPNPLNKYIMSYDLRFGSNIHWIEKLLRHRPNAELPFLFMAELQSGSNINASLNQQEIKQIRLRFSDSGKDSNWHIPEKPEQPALWQWLVGLR